MWHDFELNGEFLCLLLEIDRQIAETMREAGCGCGECRDGNRQIGKSGVMSTVSVRNATQDYIRSRETQV
jgi:hypothetical protein